MVNKVILLGRLGRDPEIRNLENGATVANFSIATSEVYYDRNKQKQEKTEWHRIVMWRRNAEIAEKYLKKGDLIYVEGKLRTRSFEDKDNNKRYITEIEVDQFQMLSSRSESKGGGNEYGGAPVSESKAPDASHPPADPVDMEDDLPF
jgi:single-strand DNA-binding protein